MKDPAPRPIGADNCCFSQPFDWLGQRLCVANGQNPSCASIDWRCIQSGPMELDVKFSDVSEGIDFIWEFPCWTHLGRTECKCGDRIRRDVTLQCFSPVLWKLKNSGHDLKCAQLTDGVVGVIVGAGLRCRVFVHQGFSRFCCHFPESDIAFSPSKNSLNHFTPPHPRYGMCILCWTCCIAWWRSPTSTSSWRCTVAVGTQTVWLGSLDITPCTKCWGTSVWSGYSGCTRCSGTTTRHSKCLIISTLTRRWEL